MDNKFLFSALTLVSLGIGVSTMPAQAGPGWLNSMGGLNGTNGGFTNGGSALFNGFMHHRVGNTAFGNGTTNGLLGNGLTNNGLTNGAWHHWHNGINSGYNNGLTNVGYNYGYNNNSGYNNGGGFMSRLFGSNNGGVMGRDQRLINQENHIQSLLASGNLSPQKAALLQNKLANLQGQQANLTGVLGNRFNNQQSYLQNMLNGGNLSAPQTAWAQNRLSRLQNAQTGLTSGTFNPSGSAGMGRFFGR